MPRRIGGLWPAAALVLALWLPPGPSRAQDATTPPAQNATTPPAQNATTPPAQNATPTPSQDGMTLPAWAGDLTGSLRGSYWSRSRALDGVDNVLTGTIWARDKLDLGAVGQISADGWVGAPSHVVGDESYLAPALRDQNYGRLREFEWQNAFGDFEVHMGRQMFLWGRADGINPTDNLTPRDFEQLTPDDSDQRFGNFAVTTIYHLGDYALNAIWQPEFQSSLIPLNPFPGVTYRYIAPSSSVGQGALKLDHIGGSADWSVSYYNGFDPMPDVAPAGLGPAGLAIGITNHREQVVGADFSAAVAEYVLRGETAWTIRDAEGTDEFFRKRSQVALVIGGERNFGGHLNVNLQFWAQKVLGFQDPNSLSDPILRQIGIYQGVLSNQVDSFEQGITFRVGYSWANDTWSAETSGIGAFTTGGYVWRGKLSHAITDHWRVNAGFDDFNGPQRSLFGYLRNTTVLYCEVRYVF